ncbi:MAG TPA: hypothetical protein VER96_04245 [Polyangiaceae bacterium]|nr:hypothetical protein [Polyangiaceae bacterium]
MSDNQNLILIDDLGNVYKVAEGEWHNEAHRLKPDDPGNATALGIVNQLSQWGTYLASVPNLGVGTGQICVVVNVGAAVKGQPSQAAMAALRRSVSEEEP